MARVALRWVQAQAALITLGMAKFEEVFLPYLLVANDMTVYQLLESRGGAMKALPPPGAMEGR